MRNQIILSIIFVSACPLLVSGQNQFVDFFPSQSTIVKGVFDTYEVNDKMYWAIPDSLLDREFCITNTILKAPENPNRDMENKYGYAGDLIGPFFFQLHRQGKNLWLMDPQHDRVIADSTEDLSRIALLTPQLRLYKRLPILSEQKGFTLVEIGQTLKNFTLFALEPAYYDMKISMRDKQRDKILEVKGCKDRLLLRFSRTYQNMVIPTPGKQAPSYEGVWETGLCISLMPKQPISMKQGDNKTYFQIAKTVFDKDGNLNRVPIIKRWRLEIRPEDRERYFRGELVEPITPIIFYVDRHFPKMFRKSIIEAVREWRPAFEQAGFKNAIDARLAPTPEEDPDFCMYDSKYPFISWKISGMGNAYGPTPCEGRGGEIMACHVGVFSSVMNLVQNWYFAQCGATDPEARKIILPESLQCELLKLVITHEIGHSLGLEHNYSASYQAPIDSLRDNAYLSRHGLGSSIMDYVRFNYALRPIDKVDFRNRRIQIGDYDRWAIEWGYREFEGNTPEKQEMARKKWYDQQKLRPELAFYEGRDVRSQQEDLGNDHVAVNTCGIENLKYLLSLKKIWRPKNELEEQVLQGRYLSLIEHYTQWSGHVFAHLGGCRMENGKNIPESIDYNRKVVRFVQDYVLTPPEWLFDAQIIQSLHLDRQKEIDKFYDAQMRHLEYALDRMGKVGENSENVLTLQELLDSLGQTVNSLSADKELDAYVAKRYQDTVAKINK